MADNAPDTRSLILFARPFAEEYSCPNYGRITVTPAVMARILLLRSTARSLAIHEIHDKFPREQIQWFSWPNTSYRDETENPEIVVDRDTVYWTGEDSGIFRTANLTIEDLRRAFAENAKEMFIWNPDGPRYPIKAMALLDAKMAYAAYRREMEAIAEDISVSDSQVCRDRHRWC